MVILVIMILMMAGSESKFQGWLDGGEGRADEDGERDGYGEGEGHDRKIEKKRYFWVGGVRLVD